jgi:hypothetical protein
MKAGTFKKKLVAQSPSMAKIPKLKISFLRLARAFFASAFVIFCCSSDSRCCFKSAS